MVDTWNAAQLNEAVNNGSTGGGSPLPAVTADDNGDVLTVVEGAWAKSSPAPSVIDYKLTEQEVGNKWVNGKPIYQKTYELTSVSSSWTALETNATVEDIIRCFNLVTPDSTDNLAYTCQARVVRETGSVDYKNSSSVSVPSGSKAYVTIQYTKKTEE